MPVDSMHQTRSTVLEHLLSSYSSHQVKLAQRPSSLSNITTNLLIRTERDGHRTNPLQWLLLLASSEEGWMDLKGTVTTTLIRVQLRNRRTDMRHRLHMEVEEALVREVIRKCMPSRGMQVHSSHSRCMGGNQENSTRESTSIIFSLFFLSLFLDLPRRVEIPPTNFFRAFLLREYNITSRDALFLFLSFSY